ncbi:MAG: secretin N-terminal domain-containing protein, partial [Pseudomonadales bacterium]|nr:secretin N-terminal domain-containing protein [Pseudomonadales bacterium]
MQYKQVTGFDFSRWVSAAMLMALLSACATQPASVPDTAVLETIQHTLDEAVSSSEEAEAELSEDDSDILNELIPSLSLDEELLAPVEERVSISSPNLPADVFFNSLVADTDYGVVISEDVDVNINLSLPNVTIEEAMDTVAEMYSLDISRRGNIFTVRPGGLRTRQFSIDYLNVQRQGSSSVQVSNGNNQNGGGLNNGLNSGLTGLNSGISSSQLLNGGVNSGLGGVGGFGGINSLSGGAGGQIQTSTSTDFWSDLETAISNLIGVQSQSSNANNNAGLSGGLFGGISNAGARNQANLTDEGKSVLVQPLTGIVIVTAYPHELERVEQFIEAAQESLRREVIIQVQFLEVILNKGFQYALDFNTFGRQANDPVTGSGSFDGSADGLLGSNNEQAGEFISS